MKKALKTPNIQINTNKECNEKDTKIIQFDVLFIFVAFYVILLAIRIIVGE